MESTVLYSQFMDYRYSTWRNIRFPVVLWTMVAYLAFTRSYMLAFNLTESLPGTLFLIDKGMFPGADELVAFRWEGNWPYPQGSIFVKQLVGLPGSSVTAQGREYSVDGRVVGVAKERAKTGELLIPGPAGVIPAGHYFVSGRHPDSLDSRYQLTGWVRRDQVVGKAFRLY